VVVPDINLLVYAYNRAAPEHVRARLWWEELLSSDTPVAIPWVVTLGFIRLMSHPAVLQQPLSLSSCAGHVHEWFSCPNVRTVDPGRRHWSILVRLLSRLHAAGNLITDAHLAAIAMEYNAELHSNDADFVRFAGLNWVNPLIERESR